MEKRLITLGFKAWRVLLPFKAPIEAIFKRRTTALDTNV